MIQHVRPLSSSAVSGPSTQSAMVVSWGDAQQMSLHLDSSCLAPLPILPFGRCMGITVSSGQSDSGPSPHPRPYLLIDVDVLAVVLQRDHQRIPLGVFAQGIREPRLTTDKDMQRCISVRVWPIEKGGALIRTPGPLLHSRHSDGLPGGAEVQLVPIWSLWRLAVPLILGPILDDLLGSQPAEHFQPHGSGNVVTSTQPCRRVICEGHGNRAAPRLLQKVLGHDKGVDMKSSVRDDVFGYEDYPVGSRPAILHVWLPVSHGVEQVALVNVITDVVIWTSRAHQERTHQVLSRGRLEIIPQSCLNARGDVSHLAGREAGPAYALEQARSEIPIQSRLSQIRIVPSPMMMPRNRVESVVPAGRHHLRLYGPGNARSAPRERGRTS